MEMAQEELSVTMNWKLLWKTFDLGVTLFNEIIGATVHVCKYFVPSSFSRHSFHPVGIPTVCIGNE